MNSNLRNVFWLIFAVLVPLSAFAIYLKNASRKYPREIKITFREGMNIREVANLLQDNEVVEKEKFFETCKSEVFKNKFDFLKYESGDKYISLEGYLFPDTYNFLKNENPVSVIKKFLNNFKKKTKDLDFSGAFDLEKILTIASFLEAESNEKSSKDVSSVIYNRIRTTNTNGKNKFGEYGLNFLQLESTMYYPYRTKEEAPKNFESNYNTYKIKGLPPGPICSPGIKFILSALNPNKTDYFYFCNDKCGNIYFAKTHSEHVKNLKKIRIL